MAALVRTGATVSNLLCSLPCPPLRSLASCRLHTSATLQDSNRASFGRYRRAKFLRTYPVVLVQPDGSTVTIQYKEPRRMLIMPIDISTLSEEERKVRMRQRTQVKMSDTKKEEEVYDDFNLDTYSQFWKKK